MDWGTLGSHVITLPYSPRLPCDRIVNWKKCYIFFILYFISDDSPLFSKHPQKKNKEKRKTKHENRRPAVSKGAFNVQTLLKIVLKIEKTFSNRIHIWPLLVQGLRRRREGSLDVGAFFFKWKCDTRFNRTITLLYRTYIMCTYTGGTRNPINAYTSGSSPLGIVKTAFWTMNLQRCSL